MRRGLERTGARVIDVGPGASRMVSGMNRVAREVGRIPFVPQFMPNQSKVAVQIHRWGVSGRLDGSDCDAVLVPVGAAVVASLQTELPLVYSSDATVRRMIGRYPQFTGLSRASLKRAEANEQRAIDRADLLVYPSEWAASSAMADYGASDDKILVHPYGANLHLVPESYEPTELRGAVELLMISTNWERKGGDVAIETLDRLVEAGVNAQLTIIGRFPDEVIGPSDRITVIPPLAKDEGPNERRFVDSMLRAHFLIAPTRAECFGVVNVEAAACGLPVLTTDVDGVKSAVAPDGGSHLFDVGDGGDHYAFFILEVLETHGRHRSMQDAARRHYERRANWPAWATAVNEEMQRRRLLP